MKVLIACEESQRVCIAFRERGHEAYSCDIQECSGGHPEWHIKGDVLPLLNGNCNFITEGGQYGVIEGKWDMIIGFPPCTYLSNVGTRHFSLKHTPAEKVVKRWELRAEAAVFFMRLALADCERVSIENPIGFMNRAFRKPNQIIEPWQFVNSTETDEYRTKKTCLWLRGLPELHRTGNLERPQPVGYWINKYGKKKNLNWEDGVAKKDSKFRSKTPSGIAKAMAEQWG